ncbi:MAG: glycosyltransferase family 4 protein [Candidatus Hydrogenedentota bacterium]
MKRLLLATDVRFWEQGAGSHMRIAAIYRHLVRIGIDVQVVFTTRLTPKDNQLIAANFPDMTVHCRPELMQAMRAEQAQRARGSLGTRLLRRLGLAAKPDPNAEKRPEDFVSTAHQRYIGELCATLRPDFLLVNYIRLAHLVDGLPREAPPVTLIDTIDVMHLRTQRYHAAGERHWINITRAEEAALLNRFDYVVAIQPRDAETLRTMTAPGRVITAMHPTAPVWHEPHDEQPVRLFYLATKGLPHQKAIAHFLGNVWPMVQERFGDNVRLCLGGSVCELYTGAPPPGVELLGYVDDVDAAYAGSHIVINPVLFGGGLKIKCVEALAHAKPLVTTAVGAEGLEDGAGTAFLLAEDDAAFAAHLDRLIGDALLRRQFAEAAYAYAQTHFTEDAAFAELRAVLEREAAR